MNTMPILIVDDDPSILRALKRIFRREGYSVYAALGAKEALDLMGDRQFPLIITDFRMPEMTGAELLIEAKKRNPKVLGIVLSGLADMQSLIFSLNSGAVHRFLEKPWDEIELVTEVKNAYEELKKSHSPFRKQDNQGDKLSINIDQFGFIASSETNVHQSLVGSQVSSIVAGIDEKVLGRICLSDPVKYEYTEPLSGMVVNISAVPEAYNLWQLEIVCSAEQALLQKGIISKQQFSEQITEQLSAGQQFALFYLDIARFKYFNEHLGYKEADLLLAHLAQILVSNTQSDVLLAQMNGPEFAMLVPGITSEESAQDHIRQIMEPFNQLIAFGQREIHLAFKVGFVLAPEDSDDADALIRNSMKAMLQGKQKGGNEPKRFSPSISRDSEDLIKLQSDLFRALERDEFSVVYQPKVSLVDGSILGAEALLRWKHEQLGFVSPAQFIPMAEVSGLIEPIGEWVLSTASSQSRFWALEGLPPFSVAINLSGRQLMEDCLPHKVAQIISHNELDPSQIELEVTETFLMQDIEHSIEMLNEIRQLGVKISIDDFGTGYSSLNYLTKLPVDTLKIDRSFIKELSIREEVFRLLKNMVGMAHDLGLTVVAEGVETKCQLDILKEIDCDEVQGFYYSPPVSADKFRNLLLKQPLIGCRYSAMEAG